MCQEGKENNRYRFRECQEEVQRKTVAEKVGEQIVAAVDVEELARKVAVATVNFPFFVRQP